MNPLLPYEEQLGLQLGDLVLPDENLAWADMKRRLDEDEDKRLIPLWLRGCAPWAFLIIVLVGIGWWLVRPEKWFVKNQPGVEAVERSGDSSVKESGGTIHLPDSSGMINRKVRDSISNTWIGTDSPVRVIKSNALRPQSINPVNNKASHLDIRVNEKRNDRRRISTDTSPITQINNKNPVDTSAHLVKNDIDSSIAKVSSTGNPIKDTLKISPVKDIPIGNKTVDSVRKDTSVVQEPLRDSSASKKESSRQPTFFSAGIAMQQQLPVDGQKWTPYNSVGRKGTLADYIPSLYGRMEKKDRWFLQAEFKYGAPQLNRPLLFYKRIDTPVIAQKLSTTSLQLEKTYYHQLALGFNHYLFPNWAIGSGMVWNKFYRAVSTQDIVEHTIATGQDTVISSGTVLRRSKPDSNFVKSYFQLLFETQFRWKRFTLGGRYTIGLQPYIRYQLPGGARQDQKNSSLQFFLRYELWKSKER
jgi:hypothetical protein